MFKVLSFIVFFAMSVGTDAKAANEQRPSQPKEFVQHVSDQIIHLIGQKELSQNEKEYQFGEILDHYFSINSIGRFVLGRYWRLATKDEKREYLNLFRDVIVETYASQFDSYANEVISVAGMYTTSDKGIVVETKISSKSKEPIRCDWKLYETDGIIHIYDIIINGVSMSVTQRSEYSALIRKKGGQVSGLLEAMREKIKEFNAEEELSVKTKS
ncbi:MAG: MlaC/ttg2D family ABC transporter substrate-binding protein [Alphaproteobacteria bacterium]